MFEKLDGSGRPPRAIQVEALSWLKSNWNKSNVLAMSLPTGVGKTFILKTLIDEFKDSAGLSPSNMLLDQYIDTYKDLNYIKGKDHYECKEYSGMSCIDSQEMFNSKCEKCQYTINKMKAFSGKSTLFNPISFFYFKNNEKYHKPGLLVIDEAHKLSDMISLLVDISFKHSKYNFPEIKTTLELISWLKTIRSFLEVAIKNNNRGLRKDVFRKKISELSKIRFCLFSLESRPQDFHFMEEIRPYKGLMDRYLCIKPVVPPKYLINKTLESTKIVLMSATLLEPNLWDLGLSNYLYKDFPSPIPKELREVLYIPAPTKFNYETRVSDVQSYIKTVLERFPDENTLIHVSYAWSSKLKPLFPDGIFNTSTDKEEKIKQFKQDGGVFFAAGCSEGLDLPDNTCRLIIIPIILKNNPNDPIYQKRINLENGRIKAEIDTIQTVIQQCGRASRHEGDKSITVIGDQSFPGLINRTRKFLPSSFLESIKWSIR